MKSTRTCIPVDPCALLVRQILPSRSRASASWVRSRTVAPRRFSLSPASNKCAAWWRRSQVTPQRLRGLILFCQIPECAAVPASSTHLQRNRLAGPAVRQHRSLFRSERRPRPAAESCTTKGAGTRSVAAPFMYGDVLWADSPGDRAANRQSFGNDPRCGRNRRVRWAGVRWSCLGCTFSLRRGS